MAEFAMERMKPEDEFETIVEQMYNDGCIDMSVEFSTWYICIHEGYAVNEKFFNNIKRKMDSYETLTIEERINVLNSIYTFMDYGMFSTIRNIDQDEDPAFSNIDILLESVFEKEVDREALENVQYEISKILFALRGFLKIITEEKIEELTSKLGIDFEIDYADCTDSDIEFYSNLMELISTRLTEENRDEILSYVEEHLNEVGGGVHENRN